MRHTLQQVADYIVPAQVKGVQNAVRSDCAYDST